MTWITDNWAGILLGLAFIAFHVFGHRGHGGGGGGGGGHNHGAAEPDTKAGESFPPKPDPTRESAAAAGNLPPKPRGHQH